MTSPGWDHVVHSILRFSLSTMPSKVDALPGSRQVLAESG